MLKSQRFGMEKVRIKIMGFKKRWLNPIYTRDGRNTRKLSVYNSWCSMINRCTNPKNTGYKYYGGRGISVCKEWLSYDNFYAWAYANGYQDGLTIDRIDVSGNYTPDNCRWVTRLEQARNTRKNVYVEGKCLSEIAQDTGIRYDTICRRYHKRSCNQIDDLLEDGVKLRTTRVCDEGYSLRQISEKTGLSIGLLKNRWERGDRSYERLAREIRSHKKWNQEVDGKSLKELSAQSGVPLDVIRSRYKNGDRTIDRLTRDVRRYRI